jgi:hypothetical protein
MSYLRIVSVVVALVALTFTRPAKADICQEKWKEGRAVHAELQRKAIEELNTKDYPAACKTMQELTRLSQDMRSFVDRYCRGNEPAKRRIAATDNIAARTKEICEQAEKR